MMGFSYSQWELQKEIKNKNKKKKLRGCLVFGNRFLFKKIRTRKTFLIPYSEKCKEQKKKPIFK